MNLRDVLVLLSEYQSIMVEANFKHNGTDEKFMADS